MVKHIDKEKIETKNPNRPRRRKNKSSITPPKIEKIKSVNYTKQIIHLREIIENKEKQIKELFLNQKNIIHNMKIDNKELKNENEFLLKEIEKLKDENNDLLKELNIMKNNETDVLFAKINELAKKLEQKEKKERKIPKVSKKERTQLNEGVDEKKPKKSFLKNLFK